MSETSNDVDIISSDSGKLADTFRISKSSHSVKMPPVDLLSEIQEEQPISNEPRPYDQIT